MSPTQQPSPTPPGSDRQQVGERRLWCERCGKGRNGTFRAQVELGETYLHHDLPMRDFDLDPPLGETS